MTQPAGALLRLEGLTKSFAGNPVLKGIDLAVERAEFLTFLGPSGCGKTTTLRIIAGFETPDEGRVLLGGADIANLPPYKRDVHTVFQHYALFPHYDVFENVAFGLRIRKVAEAEIQTRVREALNLVKLAGFEKRRTTSLSGGQMQRIALARALVGRPALLLLDEPLGALDLKLRKEMQLELKGLQKKLGITFIYVTHDQEEAMTMSDRIAVFNRGVIEQLGTPEEIYERPRTAFVADFVGAANLLSAKVVTADNGKLGLRIEDEVDIVIGIPAEPPAIGSEIQVAVRPERVAVRYRVEGEAGQDGALRLKGSLVDSVFVGNASQIFVQPFPKSGKTVMAVSMDTQHRQRRDAGSAAWIDIKPKDILVLAPDGAPQKRQAPAAEPQLPLNV
jgi:spermidine/putrescine transport system ATP-binding protein